MEISKEVVSEHPLLEEIKIRWSPRAFSATAIAEEDMQTLFEAARWAPSANNEQPWQYIYAHHGTEGFDKVWECLMPGNQPWAKNAAVLIIATARKTFEKTHKDNGASKHDLGLANSNLLLQAVSMGIYCHCMGGFDKAKTIEAFNISEDVEPVCFIAAGYRDSPDTLEEPFKTRELTPRTRKEIAEFTTKL